MSNESVMAIGKPTLILSVDATSRTQTLPTTGERFLILQNMGSNPCIVNSGSSTVTVVYPTAAAAGSATAQNGTVIPANGYMTYEKNNSNDTSIAVMCGAGLTTTLTVQTGMGK